MKDLSIIIVSWNVRDYLEKCLSSIAGQKGDLNIEVIVVDSGSEDGSPRVVHEAFPWVQLVDCGENVGFPKGNNIGLQMAQGRYNLLLNPDTEIIGDALTSLVNFLDYNKQAGVVGAQLLNTDGTIQSSRRRFPTLVTAVFESTWLQPYAPRRVIQRYYAEDLPVNAPTEVDWLTGACLMTRREVIEEVGLLDELFFMYSEELDWCRRIKEAGWQIIYVPDAQIIHHIGKSSDQAGTDRHLNFQRAKLRYFWKYHGVFAANFLRLVIIINYCWQLILEFIKGIVGHRRALRWQRVKAYWSIIRSGLKPAGY